MRSEERLRDRCIQGLVFLMIAASCPLRAEGGEQRFLRGAHWTTAEGYDTHLMINNPGVTPLPLSLALHARGGGLLGEYEIVLEPAESASRSLEELVGTGLSGHLTMAFPTELGRLPVTAVISDGKDTWIADLTQDEPDGRPQPQSARWNAIVPSSGGNQRVFLAISNPSQETAEGRAFADLQPDSGTSWRVPPGESRLIEVPRSRRSRNDHQLLTLEALKLPTGLRMVAFSHSQGRRRTAKLSLEQEAGPASGEASGFFWGQKPRLLLWNLSETPVEVGLAAVDSLGSAFATKSQWLEGNEGAEIDIRRFFGVKLDSSGALNLRYPTGQPVLAHIVGTGDGASAATLKDRRQGHAVHSFGIRLGRASNTRLLLYNPDSTEVRLSILMLMGEYRYTHPLNLLAPGQMAEVDLARDRDEFLEGQGGTFLPPGEIIGQAKIIQRGSHEQKLQVISLVESTEARQEIAFESCIICPPFIQEIFFNPNFAVGYAGSWLTLPPVMASYSDYSVYDASWECFYTSLNPSVASVVFSEAFLHTTGLADVRADYFESEPPGGDPLCFPLLGLLLAFLLLDSEPPPVCSITGPSMVLVGETVTQLTTQISPAGNPANWRTVTGNPVCIPLGATGMIGARTPTQNTVQMTCSFNDGTSADSNQFQVAGQATTQYVRLDYTAAGLAILNGAFPMAGQVDSIRSRVEASLNTIFAGSNLVLAGAPVPPVTHITTLMVEGDGGGGEAPVDVVNFARTNLGRIRLGMGSLDLANSTDPIPSTPINERRNIDRVGDAIARIAAHEIGHMLGLVPRSSELTGTSVQANMASCLMVQSLGLNGTMNHHTPGSNNANVMDAVTNITQASSWDVNLYNFTGPERTYLQRILP